MFHVMLALPFLGIVAVPIIIYFCWLFGSLGCLVGGLVAKLIESKIRKKWGDSKVQNVIRILINIFTVLSGISFVLAVLVLLIAIFGV